MPRTFLVRQRSSLKRTWEETSEYKLDCRDNETDVKKIRRGTNDVSMPFKEKSGYCVPKPTKEKQTSALSPVQADGAECGAHAECPLNLKLKAYNDTTFVQQTTQPPLFPTSRPHLIPVPWTQLYSHTQFGLPPRTGLNHSRPHTMSHLPVPNLHGNPSSLQDSTKQKNIQIPQFSLPYVKQDMTYVSLPRDYLPSPTSPERSAFRKVDSCSNEKTDIGLGTSMTRSMANIEMINGGFGIKNPLLSQAALERITDPSREPQFTCKVCGKAFEFPRLLHRHLKTHADVKRYLCTFCGKGFNDTFDLKRHTRTHTGVRPYKCNMCDKAFTQRCSLESHSRKIHGVEYSFAYKERRDKVYVCEDCGHVTKDPEEHFVHIKECHPYNPAILRCFDKRQFKFQSEKVK